ncbi:MAG: cbb3-type cytochrome c oxidase subunit 3 [Pseudomonadota bacterium]
MESLKEYFQTDWAAMTLSDWIGLIVTVGILALMIWAYVFTFHPKNKEKLESQRHLLFEAEKDDDDTIETEKRK